MTTPAAVFPLDGITVPSRSDTAEFLEGLAAETAAMAYREDMRLLGFLLAMAAMEAKTCLADTLSSHASASPPRRRLA